jgi:hypothetical protein
MLPNMTNGDESQYEEFFAKFGTHYIQTMEQMKRHAEVSYGAYDQSGFDVTKIDVLTNTFVNDSRCEKIDFGGEIGEVCKEWSMDLTATLISRYIARMCWDKIPDRLSLPPFFGNWLCNSSHSTFNVSKEKVVALDAMTFKRAIEAKESLACNFTCNRTARAYNCGLWRYDPKPEPIPKPPPTRPASFRIALYCLAVATPFMCVLAAKRMHGRARSLTGGPKLANIGIATTGAYDGAAAINEPLNGGDGGAPAAATRVV